MTFTIINAEQRSPEWFAARAGRLTGSRAADMLATIKSGEAAGRRNLRAQLVLERVTGKPQEQTFESAAMRQGAEREAAALDRLEAELGYILTRTGFLAADGLMAGCSLDGHVGNFERIVEAKAPLAATHLEYLKSGKVPGEYLKQITHNLWISGAQACDWLSYNPDFPEHLQTKIVEVARDEAAIAAYDTAARAFLAEVDRELEALRTLTDFGRVLNAAKGAA